MLTEVDAANAEHHLADLAVLTRAQAADAEGNTGAAAAELGRPEMLASTNRLFLKDGADLALQDGAPSVAAALYDRAATFPSWKADHAGALLAGAQAHEAAGETDVAAADYRALIQSSADTTFGAQAGQALARLNAFDPLDRGILSEAHGDDAGARAAYGQAARSPDQADAGAQHLAALDAAEAWRSALAAGTAGAFRTFYQRYPQGRQAGESRFREGLVQYEQGGVSAATNVWQAALEGASPTDAARLQVWIGKADTALGQPQDAATAWRQGAALPGYYGARAADLLNGQTGWPDAAGQLTNITPKDTQAAEAWLAQWAGPDAEPPAAALEMDRLAGLLAFNMAPEAAAEADGAVDAIPNPWFSWHVANLLDAQKVWPSSARAAAQLVDRSPSRSLLSAPIAVRRLAYPPAYRDQVQASAPGNGVNPWLLLALIRQESRYDASAVSVAGALGLAQIMPATGSGIAQALKQPFNTADLLQADIAISFGAWYLGRQLTSLPDTWRAVAAYNAGSGAVRGWPGADGDEFVEHIPYAETKDYVQQVYLHEAVYRSLLTS
ncbi:MAG: lytic transglycosylase domain-containing protein [Chloroflexi bacterium]|nr:lytic transglycosylase domain-containing protein [Chloroflexota bacterium]